MQHTLRIHVHSCVNVINSPYYQIQIIPELITEYVLVLRVGSGLERSDLELRVD
jgi:hypothetical protein